MYRALLAELPFYLKMCLCFFIVHLSLGINAQKSIYIPNQFSNSPWNEWSWDKTYESENFIIFWGNKLGTDPKNYHDPNLAFDPAQTTAYLESSYKKFVDEIGFVENTSNLAKYKIIIVIANSYEGPGGPTYYASGSAYDGVIGAMWVTPAAAKNEQTLSHEFAHTCQSMIAIQHNPDGGYMYYEPGGSFWESHANFMRYQQYPSSVADDFSRWLMSRHFYLASTRHHYQAYRWLLNIQSHHGGIDQVNRLWHESIRNETATETWRRINNWTQQELNDHMYDYARREVNFDYPVNGFGGHLRWLRDRYRTEKSENWRLMREFTILDRLDSAESRFVVPDYMAPADYGFNVIPLHPSCSATGTVRVKLRGHEVNEDAGWRWGFVEVTESGESIYGTLETDNAEAEYTLSHDSSELFLVVMGAPDKKHDYHWEPGWPKVYRYPYELVIIDALPEGYQEGFRQGVVSLFDGAPHINGGGFVSSLASVDSSVYVGARAMILGQSKLTGQVRVEGTARIDGVTASMDVTFEGHCNVRGGSYTKNVRVKDGAIAIDCNVSDGVVISDNAFLWSGTYIGPDLVLGGDTEIGDCATSGYYMQVPHSNNGRSSCDGKGATEVSNMDINGTYVLFADSLMQPTTYGCQGPPLGNFIYLDSLSTMIVADASGNKYGRAIALIKNDRGTGLPGIKVVGQFGGSFDELVLGETDESGKVDIFTSRSLKKKNLHVEFCVTKVTHDIVPYEETGGQQICEKFSEVLAMNALGEVRVYPNPAQDVITLDFSHKSQKPFSVSILSLNGAQVLREDISSGQERVSLSLKARGVTNGIYLLRIHMPAGLVSKKLVVSN